MTLIVRPHQCAALGIFMRCEEGKARTETAVDAGNFNEFRRVAKDKVVYCIICIGRRRVLVACVAAGVQRREKERN